MTTDIAVTKAAQGGLRGALGAEVLHPGAIDTFERPQTAPRLVKELWPSLQALGPLVVVGSWDNAGDCLPGLQVLPAGAAVPGRAVTHPVGVRYHRGRGRAAVALGFAPNVNLGETPMPAKPTPADLTLLVAAMATMPDFALARVRMQLVLGAYRLYPKVQNMLRQRLDWDGSAATVASDLVDRLKGLEAIPGLPALAPLVQALEEAGLGDEHLPGLVAMRQRLRWGMDLDQAPVGGVLPGPGDAAVIPERIIGIDRPRPVADLHRMLRAAEAVVRVDAGQRTKGTGFMIAPDLMLTARHVVPDAATAASTEVRFFYQSDLDGGLREGVMVPLAKDALLIASEALDATLLRVAGAPLLDHYPPLYVGTIAGDQRLPIIQHPGGGPKRIAFQDNFVAEVLPEVVQYFTATEGGSSGAPVFDDDMRVVALHRGAVQCDDFEKTSKVRAPADPGALRYRNQGARMSGVVEWIRGQDPGLLAGVRIEG